MKSKAIENVIDGLPSEELSLISEFLDDAADEFADHGCNDFTRPATDENKAIFVAVVEHHGEDDANQLSVEEIMTSKDQVFVYDDWAMRYFAERCEKRLKNPRSTPALTRAELDVMGALLESAAQWHEEYSAEVCYDLTFPATDANKALMARVIKSTLPLIAEHADVDYKRAAEEKAVAAMRVIAESKGEEAEIDIPDFWIMRHLANRCKTLSQAA